MAFTKENKIKWHEKRQKVDGKSWLVFYIVVCFLLSTGAFFGVVGTKWIMNKECSEAKNGD